MKNLRERHGEYIDMLREKGVPIALYVCPTCYDNIETREAPEGQMWDTMASCPNCGGLHMKYTNGPDVSAAEVPL